MKEGGLQLTKKTLQWSGYEWIVKNGARKTGPGPNYFAGENAWVDRDGRLHLRITKHKNTWRCAEVTLSETLGYGTYRFWLEGRPDRMDLNGVLGLFTYDESSPEQHHREIDIEFAKWGNPGGHNAQYVVQPYSEPGNLHSFPMKLNGNCSTHTFKWTPGSIRFMSLHGHYTDLPSPLEWFKIQDWEYTGDVPDSRGEKVGINLWLMDGKAPAEGMEIIVDRFEFEPLS